MSEYLRPVCCQTIAELDNGAFGKAVNHVITQIVRDILDRPSNASGKAETRKVEIILEFKPETEFDKDARTVDLKKIWIEPHVKGKVPAFVGGPHDTRIHQNALSFNPGVPHDFNQPPLFDEEHFEDADEPGSTEGAD